MSLDEIKQTEVVTTHPDGSVSHVYDLTTVVRIQQRALASTDLPAAIEISQRTGVCPSNLGGKDLLIGGRKLLVRSDPGCEIQGKRYIPPEKPYAVRLPKQE